MTKVSRHIPEKVRAKLLKESGGACANPGCSNVRTEIHHIDEWAIYKTHNSEAMIAICPACHDACHNGILKITDDTLHKWKKIKRHDQISHAHIFVSPSEELSKIICGSFSVSRQRKGRLVVIEVFGEDALSFEVKENWLLVSGTISDRDGNPFINIMDNKISIKKNEEFTINQYTGRLQVTAPVRKYYVHAGAILSARKINKDYGTDESLIIFDLEVCAPGTLRISGVWPGHSHTLIIMDNMICICPHNSDAPQVIRGRGDESVLLLEAADNGPFLRL